MEQLVRADAILTENGFEYGKSIQIEDGVIKEVRDTGCFGTHREVIDFSGYTLSPCFCDYHLHFFEKKQESLNVISDTLISYGITKVIEGGDSEFAGFNAKSLLKSRVDIVTAGFAVYKQGTYGQYIGRGVANIREARELIAWLHAEGVSYIKIINSGIFRPGSGEITPGGFEKDELREIVTYAKERGLDVECHANGEGAVGDAVEAGVSSVIHGMNVSEETLSMMSDKDIKFIPTINAFLSLSGTTLDSVSGKNIEEAVDGHLSAVKSALEKGVRVLPGSDSGASFIPYGSSYLAELLMFRKAGLSDKDILLSAVKGRLRKGDKADFLVLKGLEPVKVFRSGLCISG
ncbi:MAG: amidohydrolase family protein [Nitrospirota bacterium]